MLIIRLLQKLNSIQWAGGYLPPLFFCEMIPLDVVKKIAEPLAENQGLEILLLEEKTEQGQRILRIYLDSPHGVQLEDCEKLSRLLSPILETEPGFDVPYNLEVSSPGVNRPLVKIRHFEAQIGNIIELSTQEEIEGRRKFKGKLEKVKSEDSEPEIEISVDNKIYQIPYSQIKRAQLDYFASQALKNKEK